MYGRLEGDEVAEAGDLIQSAVGSGTRRVLSIHKPSYICSERALHGQMRNSCIDYGRSVGYWSRPPSFAYIFGSSAWPLLYALLQPVVPLRPGASRPV